MIKRTCENCLFSFGPYPPFKMVCKDCHYAQNDKDDPDTCFQAKEELIRKDEQEKILNEIIDTKVVEYLKNKWRKEGDK